MSDTGLRCPKCGHTEWFELTLSSCAFQTRGAFDRWRNLDDLIQEVGIERVECPVDRRVQPDENVEHCYAGTPEEFGYDPQKGTNFSGRST